MTTNQHQDGKCKCFACEKGMEALEKMQQEFIEKVGWYAHFVSNDPRCPYSTNLHTHNLMEKFGHKDLQICLNIAPQVGHAIFVTIIDEIKKGKKFEAGKEYDEIFDGGFKAKFIDAFETGRPVLRVLVPGPDGKYEGKYAEQLTKLNNEEFNPNNN